MNTCQNRLNRGLRLGLMAAAAWWALAVGGCADDVGHSRTTTTETVRTPEGTTTVTETHEKNTTLSPR